MKKAFVLLSGGIDSTTCLYKAVFDFAPDPIMVPEAIEHRDVPWIEAVSVRYGQRHFLSETEMAHRTCDRLGIKHTILDVQNILSGKQVMLTDDSVEIPDIDYADIKGVSPTYVPFRNGTLLSIITAHAQKWVNSEIAKKTTRGLYNAAATAHMKDSAGIYFGAHSEDAQNWAYPDCTPEFIGAMANAIYIGSYFCIRLHTPIQWLTKQGVIELGDSMGVKFEDTWSCYKGGDLHCGVCPTCRSRRDAFQSAAIVDPTEYETEY